MNNQKSTKRALISSVLSLVLCMSMLIGTTFAWFTDTASSKNNRIVAGNLDVDLLMYDAETDKYESIANGEGDIFDAAATANNSNETLWEPGKTQIVYLAVENKGNLALKYNIMLNIVDNGLVGALEYALIDGAENDTYTLGSWEDVKETTTQVGDITAGITMAAPNGTLDEIVNGTENERDYFALAVHMKEEAGNEYQGKDIVIDITVNATQVAAESDSFNNQYDAGAGLPVAAQAASQKELNAAIAEGANTIYLEEGTYKLPSTTNNEISLIGNGETVVDLSYATGQTLSGTDVTLENLTVTGVNQDYAGLQHVGNVVYNNVVFNNSTNLYGESVTFNNCTFNLTSRYIWTYGAGVATFNNCTFYTEGKAILAYKESDPATYTVNINDCAFYATQAGYTGAGAHCAAVEIDSHLVGAYVINFNGTNTVSTNFAGLYRVKAQKDPANTTVNQNGTVVTTDLVPVSDGLFTDANANYYVSNAEGLMALHDNAIDPTWGTDKLSGKSINVMADIDAEGKTWQTITMMTGSASKNGFTFNGNGYTISNLTITKNPKAYGTGLFTLNSGLGNPSVFKNITFNNVTVNGGSHHTGVVWGELAGNITLENVNVINSKVSGDCNVGGLVGRNSETHANITFKDCSVKNTTVEAKQKRDNAGASAFLGMALHIGSSCSANVVFEGTNVAEGNNLVTAAGMQGGGIYTCATWDDDTWSTPTVVNDFTNYNSNN